MNGADYERMKVCKRLWFVFAGLSRLASKALLARPRGGAPFLRGFRFLDQGFLADDDDDTRIGDVEAALVGFQVIADLGALGKADVAVDDGAADARVVADVHVVVDDGF